MSEDMRSARRWFIAGFQACVPGDVEVAELAFLDAWNSGRPQWMAEPWRQLGTFVREPTDMPDGTQLSVRSMSCLVNHGFGSWIEVHATTDAGLLKVRNLGRKSLKEIRDALWRNGSGPRPMERRVTSAGLLEDLQADQDAPMVPPVATLPLAHTRKDKG